MAKEDLFGNLEGLTPEEWRSRVILQPEFRETYNEIVEADRQFPVPQYLWEKWVPLLGVFPVAVYLELRRMCFVNRATGERRDWCWPRQETIARRLGVRKRHTVGKALEELESRGFIKREASYRKRGADAFVKRGADRYLVYFEVPLIPADAEELLRRRMDAAGAGGGALLGSGVVSPPVEKRAVSDMAVKRPYRELAVGKTSVAGPDMAGKRPHAAGRETASRNVTRTNFRNVSNVGMSGNGKRQQRVRAEALALEIGETLSTWAGVGAEARHGSEGFHRLVASRMPEHLIRQALMATRDAVERARSGKGGCTKGPSAYFAGVTKILASENGVELGLRSGPTADGVKGSDPRNEVDTWETGREIRRNTGAQDLGACSVLVRGLVERVSLNKRR